MHRLNIASKIIATPLLVCLFFVPASNVFAAPSISGVSGTIANGSSFTIAGSGFGTKSQAAPWLWDNFETGTSGSPVAGHNGWQEYGSNTSHRYHSGTAWSGSLSARNQSGAANWFEAVGQHGLVGDELYVTYRVKWSVASGTVSGGPIIKWFRANSQPDFYHSQPSVWVTLQPPGAGWMYADSPNGVVGSVSQQDIPNNPLAGDPWARFELYWRLSTPGVADGDLQISINHQPGYSNPNSVTRGAGMGSQHVENFLLTAMHDDQGSGALFNFFVDDVYVDTTRSRVEVCNSSTWATRTRCEPQIPSTWSPTSITVTGATASFLSGTAYVYVVDSGGSVNANGYAVTIGGGGDTTPPAAPAGLNVQ